MLLIPRSAWERGPATTRGLPVQRVGHPTPAGPFSAHAQTHQDGSSTPKTEMDPENPWKTVED